MKKSIKTIGIIATMGIMLVFSYYLGTAQTKTVPAVQTAAAIKAVAPDGYILFDEYIPYDNNYIDMDTVVDFSATEYGLQLYFADGSGYYWERQYNISDRSDKYHKGYEF